MADRKEDCVGEEVGPYRLTRLLGKGGFGEVYEADHRLLGQPRAIKLLLERHFHDPKARERFLREARTLAALEHPNILSVLEVDEAGELLYLVMPLYQRGTLSDVLKQRATPLPLAEVERSLAQICAALSYAHARGIAHLDLKPENLLLHEDGRLVLADFGLAHLLKQGRLEAGSSASWGTPYYMAPEQIRGAPEPRSDLYALGIILYQMLTRQRPFRGATPEAVMMKHLLEAPPALQAMYPAAPAALEPVVQKALAKQPADRYQTAEALWTDFSAAMSSPTLPTKPSASAVASAVWGPQMAGPELVARPTISGLLNEPKAPAAVCEIDHCAVQAVGRCVTCKRAFCVSHQGSYRNRNMCVPCLEMERAEMNSYLAEISAAEEYIRSGAARTALLTSGVSPVNLCQVGTRGFKRGLFGPPRYERIDVVTPFGRGWILGEFKWKYSVGPRRGQQPVVDTCLTTLLDRSPGDPLFLQYPEAHGALARVEPYPGGYKVLLGGEFIERNWMGVAQAVRRLAKMSS